MTHFEQKQKQKQKKFESNPSESCLNDIRLGYGGFWGFNNYKMKDKQYSKQYGKYNGKQDDKQKGIILILVMVLLALISIYSIYILEKNLLLFEMTNRLNRT